MLLALRTTHALVTVPHTELLRLSAFEVTPIALPATAGVLMEAQGKSWGTSWKLITPEVHDSVLHVRPLASTVIQSAPCCAAE